ncbi:MAG: hypothetical protein JWQ14_642 [Adhaeribacter sp.]|nr:hypothetical protein [Adhaeribacter sp.]
MADKVAAEMSIWYISLTYLVMSRVLRPRPERLIIFSSSSVLIMSWRFGNTIGSKLPDRSLLVSSSNSPDRLLTFLLVLPFLRLDLPAAFSCCRWASNSPPKVASKKCLSKGAKMPCSPLSGLPAYKPLIASCLKASKSNTSFFSMSGCEVKVNFFPFL